VARMGAERKVYRILVGKRKEIQHLEDQGVDGRMGSGWILGRLAQDRGWWRALVNAVMNICVLAPRSWKYIR
jgi:hypothetical protein